MLTPAGQSPSELNLGAIIMAGGTAGVAMWSIAIPPDVRELYFAVELQFNADNSRITGLEVKNPVSPHRNVLWLLRLCTKDDCR